MFYSRADVMYAVQVRYLSGGPFPREQIKTLLVAA
jgi:hypothetical protein